MKYKRCRKNKLNIFLIFLFFLSIIGITGCDDSGVAPPPPTVTDTNVVIFNNVGVFFWDSIAVDSTSSGVNLLKGDSTRWDSEEKDMLLMDSAGTFSKFYFLSGDLAVNPGYKTRFNRVYGNITPAQFDTLSVIPISDSLLKPSNFIKDSTGYWGTFSISQNKFPVFSFYLEGRNNTGSKYIYGVFHVRHVFSAFNGQQYGVLIVINIKLNKAGKNHFVVKSPA
jgi:hypothetical protein